MQSEKFVAVFFHELAPIFETEAAITLGEERKEERRPLANALQRTRHRRRQHMVALQRDFHVATELLKARVADGDSEVASRHIFQLVGFVENNGADLGQDSGIGRVFGLLLDGEIGKEQMMVDDDDVALHRPTVHLRDEAAVPGAAFLSQAGVGAGVKLVPECARFGKRSQFGLVS